MSEAPVVRHDVVVRGTPEQAFAAFTERMDEIKPKEHNLLGSPIVSTTFEPRVGGHIVDRCEDGSECRWARVLVYDPPGGWCSAGTSDRPGSWRQTPTTPARSRFGSSPMARTGPGSSSSIG